MADENEDAPEGQDKPADSHGKLIIALFTCVGTLIGVLGKGCFDVQVEQQKTITELRSEEQKASAEQKLEEQKASAEQQLERQRFDAELVKTALASADQEKRIQFLEFMVQTHLILEKDIRDGVEGYVNRAKQNPTIVKIPQFEPGLHLDWDKGTVDALAEAFEKVLVKSSPSPSATPSASPSTGRK